METIEKLMETFYGEVYWSSLENYDEVMSQIVGFKEFKQELRNQIEVAERRKKRGRKPPQIFYVLLGKPGVGKSEICQRLAKALKRPILIINVGGMEHVSELEGKAPSYSAANYGKITSAYVDSSVLIKYNVKDLEKEVKKMKDRDISEALILLTANYLSAVPDFVKDRCKPVNIELLTYQQRLEVLRFMVEEMVVENDIEDLKPLISDNFLKMCITETWGIRGGINNLVATMDFLELMEVRKVANEFTDLADYDDY
ncbi:3603_t:CDS:2, partial [Paraglomus brasilianum]